MIRKNKVGWAGMNRRSLIWLVLLLMLVGLVTPMAIRAEAPPVPVVLIHGQGGSPDMTWKTAIAYLEQRGYTRGVTLFAVDLSAKNEREPLGLMADAAATVAEIHAILRQTGAERVDLVGHSRGGLVARLIAEGGTGPVVRRVVTIDTPHDGALPAGELQRMLAAAGLRQKKLPKVEVPADLQVGSLALTGLQARERRFADRTVPVLAIASTWREGLPDMLQGHDGAVAVSSQLAWPGARTALFRLGPKQSDLDAMLKSELGAALLVWNSPHLQSLESPEVLQTVADFLAAPNVLPSLRPCDPDCKDWAGLAAWDGQKTVWPWLADLIPYDVGPDGQRLFQPGRPMTRAEFVYGLARGLGLEEDLAPPMYLDLQGHWAAGWVEAARKAKLLPDGRLFVPDAPITRAEAAHLLLVAKGLPLNAHPSRYSDVRGHWAEPEIEAVAALGYMAGEDEIFRPDEPLTMGEGALTLVRAFR
jgi:pimeloyl-ACP methyl ester carboxylesterase